MPQRLLPFIVIHCNPIMVKLSIRNAISSDRLQQQLAQSEDRLRASILDRDRPDGSLHIGIVESGNFYEFTIADDRPGIAPEQHDRVFEILRAVNPQNRSDSTGIGLALAEPTGGNRQKNCRSRRR
jgi:signal transduction histidine kinase